MPRYLVTPTFETPTHLHLELGDICVHADDEAEAERKAFYALRAELTVTLKGRIADVVPDSFYDRVIT